MKTSPAGVALIKRFEGLRLEAYRDAVGIWTIGYGHTGNVWQGAKITEHQADVILEHDLERFEEGVQQATRTAKLTQGEFDALVSFSFNLGVQALVNSTLLKKLLKGDRAGAADEFLKWDKARVGGKLTVLAGLTKRRQAERERFLS